MVEAGAETVIVGARRSGGAKFARMVGGWALVMVGLLGFVLPVVPGVPLLLAGLALLAKDYAWARLALQRVKAWLARVKQKLTRRAEAA